MAYTKIKEYLKKISNAKNILLLLCLIETSAFAYLDISPWNPVLKGVEHATAQTDEPRLQKVNALKVDLYDEDIVLMTTPSNGASPGDTNRQTASQFMTTHPVRIGVNAQFKDVSNPPPYPGADLLGLAINEGQIVSQPETYPYLGCTLLVTQNNTAHFEYTTPATDLTGIWTAIECWPWFLKNGINYGDPTTASIHPRTAIGLSLDRRYLIIIIIDGRQTGYSEGATYYETAEWLKRFGAFSGLNLDGGGSTHMWITDSNGATYAMNSPSENRSVGNHLGIYAEPLGVSDTYIYANFENQNESTFSLTPGYSGSTYGIIADQSTADATNAQSYQGNYSQKLSIIDDPAQSGGWMVRHVSGGSASRTQNAIRPTEGFVGLWAKTTTPSLEISIAIDNTANVTADRGVFKSLINDDSWHLYQWDLQDDNDWQGWVNGDGLIDTIDFTLDSIQIIGPDQNAEIYLDEISHSSKLSLAYLFTIKGDFEPDGDVDLNDFAQLALNWSLTSNDTEFETLYDISSPADNLINFRDLKAFTENWLQSN